MPQLMVCSVEAHAARSDNRVGTPVVPHWRNRERLSVVVLLIAVAGVNLLSLLRYPAPFVDEGWNANRAWALLQTGRAFGTLDSGVFDRYEGYWTYFPWLGTSIHALGLRLLGLSLLSMRLVSLLFGLVLLVTTYTIAGRLYGHRIGLAAALLLSMSAPFVLSSHMARHDVMVAAFGYGAIALYLTDQTPARALSARALLSGLLVGLVLDLHPLGAIFAPALVAVYLLDHRWSLWRAKRFWCFVAGACAGTAYYLSMHVFPYPTTFAALLNLGFGSARNPGFPLGEPGAWLQLALELCLVLYASVGFLAVLLVPALVLLLRRRSPSDKRALVLFVVLLLEFVVLVGATTNLYMIVLAPAIALLVPVLLVDWFRSPWSSSRWAFARLSLACALLVALVFETATPMFGDPMKDYQAVLDGIRQTVPPGNSVMGSQTYWFALPEERFLSPEQIAYYQRYAPGSTVADALQALRPDFLILDRHVDRFIVDDREAMTELQYLFVPRAEVQSVLEQRGRLIDTVDTRAFGEVRIYKISWN